jgi:hypothetical protein
VDEKDGSKLLDQAAAATLVECSPEDLPPGIPTLNGPRWHPEDLRNLQREILDELSPADRAKVRARENDWKRGNPAALVSIRFAVKRCPERIPQILEDAFAGKSVFRANSDGFEFELVANWTVMQEVRDERRRERAARLMREDRRLRLWAISNVIDIPTVELFEASGGFDNIAWLSSDRCRLYAIEQGDPRRLVVFSSERYGFIPCPPSVFNRLLENSRDFRAALRDGWLRVVERPAETK